MTTVQQVKCPSGADYLPEKKNDSLTFGQLLNAQVRILTHDLPDEPSPVLKESKALSPDS